MKLISALIIFSSPDPDLHSQMKEAIKTIKAEELKDQSFLCRETVSAILKMKSKNGIQPSGTLR